MPTPLPTGDDDLCDVVPIPDFDTKYPILHTSHLIWRDPDNPDLLQALKDTVAAYDQTRDLLKNMTATEVMSKIDEYMLLPISQVSERREILHSLARQGLTARTILNLIPGTPHDQRRALAAMISDKGQLTDEHAERILRADEMMAQGTARHEIREACGIHENQLRCIARWRNCADIGYEGAMKWAFCELMRGERAIDVVHRMHAKFPQEAATIPYHTIYGLTIPSRIERNKRRFNWTEEDAA